MGVLRALVHAFEYVTLFGVALLAILAIVVVVQTGGIGSTSPLLYPIGVPGTLSEEGYREEVVTYRLLDRIAGFQRQGREAVDFGLERRFPVTWAEDVGIQFPSSDFEVPGTTFSFRSVVRTISESLGVHFIEIRGEIVEEIACDPCGVDPTQIKAADGSGVRQSKFLRLRLRILNKERAQFMETKVFPGNQIDDLLKNGAEELVKVLDPSLLYLVYANEQDWQKADDLFDWMIKNNDSNSFKAGDDDYLAYLLRAHVSAVEAQTRHEVDAEKLYQRALESTNFAAELRPDRAEPLVLRGEIERRRGLYDDAIADFRLALKRNDNLPDAFVGLAGVYREQGKFKDALTQVERALALDPKNYYAYVYKAYFSWMLGDTQAAIENSKKATELRPDLFLPYLYWANVLNQLGKTEQANMKYQQALQRAALRDKPTIYNDWAFLVFETKKDHEGALAAIEKGLAIDPKSGLLLWTRGEILGAVGRIPDAIASFEQAIHLLESPAARKTASEQLEALKARQKATKS